MPTVAPPSALAPLHAASMTTSEITSPMKDLPARVYVPNAGSHTVDVIDPATFKVVDHYNVGRVPHHIAPSYDMTKLYVDNTAADSLTVIDPTTGKPSG